VADGVSITVVEPYDFRLTLRTMRSFGPAETNHDPVLKLAARIVGSPTLIEVKLGPRDGLKASSRPKRDDNRVRSIVQWVLFAELDLKPFYRITAGYPKLAFIADRLYGLKPSRPVSLFEMAVTAITEQQLSLTSAYKIRDRIVRRFGEAIEDRWVFPEPRDLANASLEDLRACGLSYQKSEYIRGLADKIATGNFDLDSLKLMDTDQARETIMNLRGFGRWSADYILVRGLARPDCVPTDDIGIQNVVGKYLGSGQRLSSQEVAEKLEPFRPYRGLLAFYLLAAYRLNVA
jgi:DNA-3-methyladenine glycosylase II